MPELPKIRLYNTLSRTKETLEPVAAGKVGIYLCGPTVYDKAHMGHMVGPVVFDCVKRYLTYCGYDVTWVVNITDVDDKLITKANERRISMAEVAAENTADYMENLAALGVDTIDHYPKATEHMDEIIRFCEQLVERGHAYESDGDVYFEVGKDPEYGKLSNRSVDASQGEGGEMAARKRAAGDFALWKGAKPGEPAWDSPWGKGRPGWHIECSAMSRVLLGETFDIHGGGLDLVFPHHENEVAQSECCHQKPMVNYWMHNGLMQAAAAAGKVGGRGEREASEEQKVAGKLSRSAGASSGQSALAGLIERQGGERLRFFLVRTHYRSTIVFGEEGIEEAGAGLETFYRFFKRLERITGESFYDLPLVKLRSEGALDAGGDAVLERVSELRNQFLEAMDDDFNSGGATAALFEIVGVLNKYCEDAKLETAGKTDADKLAVLRTGSITLRELAATLGIFLKPPAAKAVAGGEVVNQLMDLLIDIRASSRKNKDFDTADQVRNGLTAAGVTLEDRADGTDWTSNGADQGSDLLNQLMQLIIAIRADSRAKKDFATADKVRDALVAANVTLEDRADGTDWSLGS